MSQANGIARRTKAQLLAQLERAEARASEAEELLGDTVTRALAAEELTAELEGDFEAVEARAPSRGQGAGGGEGQAGGVGGPAATGPCAGRRAGPGGAGRGRTPGRAGRAGGRHGLHAGQRWADAGLGHDEGTGPTGSSAPGGRMRRAGRGGSSSAGTAGAPTRSTRGRCPASCSAPARPRWSAAGTSASSLPSEPCWTTGCSSTAWGCPPAGMPAPPGRMPNDTTRSRSEHRLETGRAGRE